MRRSCFHVSPPNKLVRSSRSSARKGAPGDTNVDRRRAPTAGAPAAQQPGIGRHFRHRRPLAGHAHSWSFRAQAYPILALTVPFKHFHPCDSLHLRLRCVMKKCMPIANSVAPPVD